MVVGFGCNVYGRFSLAGAYDPSTGNMNDLHIFFFHSNFC